MPGKPLTVQSPTNQLKKTYKVLIADDHAIFRHGLKVLLNKYSFIQFSGEASNGTELKDLASKTQPDLIFMDIHMPGGDGIDATREILKIYPEIKIVVLSSYDDSIMVKKMMELGASAYLTKTITLSLLDTLFKKLGENEIFISPDAAQNVVMHQLTTTSSPVTKEHTQWLEEEISPRQKQVLEMLSKGNSAKEISSQLNIGLRTIETHREKLLRKFGVKNTAELVAKAHEYRVV